MQYKLVKEVFEDYTEIRNEKDLAKSVIAFLTDYITKNPNHVSFFGGALLGVDRISWTQVDINNWLHECLFIDDVKNCQRDISELPNIVAEYKISSDIVNLSFIWVIHKLYISDIKESLKRDAMFAALNLAQITHLTWGIHGKRFEYGVDPLIAQSLYESLDRKSDLKAQGSWYGLLNKKSEVFLEKSDGFTDVWERMDNDRRVIELANEIHGRINKMLNNLTGKFYEIYDAQSQIKADSKLATVDGEQVLRDYVSRPGDLVNRMEAISRDEYNFIKEELIEATLGLVNTCSRKTLTRTLDYYSTNFYGDRKIQQLQKDIIVYMLAVTRRDKIKSNDIPAVVKYVRNMFRSSGTKNKEVLDIKDGLQRVADKANKNAKYNVLVSAQVALLLYVVLRALTVKAYS